jgi:kanamycin kinase
VAGERPVTAVWKNELGGLTFAVHGPAGADDSGDRPELYVKWAPAESHLDYGAEAARLAWAGRFTPVPEVLRLGRDPGGSWLVTRARDGHRASDRRWRAGPAVAVRAIGEGLRALHDALPTDSCPWSWSAEGRVERARLRAADGLQRPGDWHKEHGHLSTEDALARLSEVPPVDRLVVCHGDACAPNTLLDESGRWSAHVDFECMGVADRWADLAIATWSCDWNFGPGWQDELLAAYGVEADPGRTSYYRLLWDLS